MEKTDILLEVCRHLLDGDRDRARNVVQQRYPFAPIAKAKRSYTAREATQVFVRDGFVDRYSGQRLVFPGIFRLIARTLPAEFPFQKNWKMSETHAAFWELFPTVDHLVPVARGGLDEESNWVTTSQLHNSAKANWTLEELGWMLHEPGDPQAWDGLTGLFFTFVKREPSLLREPYLRTWHQAALAAGLG